ncbi:hypothetical protein TNCV_1969541 [Trichonephila clavipes]|nr:hypothetical protein TNCV_1969541 [Trichonephila clavipes]
MTIYGPSITSFDMCAKSSVFQTVTCPERTNGVWDSVRGYRILNHVLSNRKLKKIQKAKNSPVWKGGGDKSIVYLSPPSPSVVPSGNFAELIRTVTCLVLKANDRRTSSLLP